MIHCNVLYLYLFCCCIYFIDVFGLYVFSAVCTTNCPLEIKTPLNPWTLYILKRYERTMSSELREFKSIWTVLLKVLLYSSQMKTYHTSICTSSHYTLHSAHNIFKHLSEWKSQDNCSKYTGMISISEWWVWIVSQPLMPSIYKPKVLRKPQLCK